MSLQCNFNRGYLSRLQSFDYLQAPTFARPADCTHPRAKALDGQAVYTTHSSVGYLPRDMASLGIRHDSACGMRLDFHQLARNPVGCSNLQSVPIYSNQIMFVQVLPLFAEWGIKNLVFALLITKAKLKR